jgi:hypothetical protein
MARKARELITFVSQTARDAAADYFAPVTWVVRRVTGTADPRERAAAHEAGHALAAWSSIHVSCVTGARLRGIGSGSVNFDIRDAATLHSAAWDATMISLAGLAGEIIAFGNVRSGDAEDDLITAREAAERIIAGRWARPWQDIDGKGLDIGAMFIEPPSPAVSETLRQCYLRARSVVTQRPDLFSALRDELLLRGEIDADGIKRLLGERPWATFR